MKKALIIFGVITGMFICLMIGIYIGRSTVKGSIRIYADNVVTEEVTETLAEDEIGLINLNTATAEELCYLPGIGESLAQRIIDYREENGEFNSVDDLINVRGIGEKILAQIRDYLTT